MQRKNSILKSSRNGIAMIMAIAVIVIMAGVMALSISMTANTSKRTVDLYLYEQSILLSKSATEYALLQIAQNAPCSLTNLNFNPDIDGDGTADIYNINIDMQYIYNTNASCIANGGTLYTLVTTPEQNGSVIMDVTVSVPQSENISNEPIRYFRRTIQKL